MEWLHFFSAFGYHILIMYLRIPRYLVALISVMVFVLAGQTSVQGYVWCLGENRHAALEHPVAGDCHGAERAPGVCGDEHSDNEDDSFHAFCEVASCGPCLDLPASVKANFRRAGDFDADDILIDLPLVGFSPIQKFIKTKSLRFRSILAAAGHESAALEHVLCLVRR